VSNEVGVGENLVEIWGGQFKVFEKKWEERNYTVTRRLHV
jgi:hypothetical protein